MSRAEPPRGAGRAGRASETLPPPPESRSRPSPTPSTARADCPDATRRHVREVADRLGYRPSAAARTLRTGKSGLIGLTVTTYGEEPFTFTEFAYFAEMAQSRHLGRARPGLRPGHPARLLPPRRVVRTSPSTAPSSSTPPTTTRSSANSSGRACPWSATAARPAPCPVTAWVDNDHEAAVLGILDHLAAAGARRIGLLTGTTHRHLHPAVHHRLPGLVRARRPGAGLRGLPGARSRARAPSPPTGCSPAPTAPTPSTASSTRTAPTCWPRPAATACASPTTCCWSAAASPTVYATTEPPDHHPLPQAAPHRHGRGPAADRRHRGRRAPDHPGRAGDTDRADRARPPRSAVRRAPRSARPGHPRRVERPTGPPQGAEARPNPGETRGEPGACTGFTAPGSSHGDDQHSYDGRMTPRDRCDQAESGDRCTDAARSGGGVDELRGPVTGPGLAG